MGIYEKGPGDQKYGSGKVKSMKRMPDGNPYPYEQECIAENGVEDLEKVDGFNSEPDMSSKVEKQTGDDGKG